MIFQVAQQETASLTSEAMMAEFHSRFVRLINNPDVTVSLVSAAEAEVVQTELPGPEVTFTAVAAPGTSRTTPAQSATGRSSSKAAGPDPCLDPWPVRLEITEEGMEAFLLSLLPAMPPAAPSSGKPNASCSTNPSAAALRASRKRKATSASVSSRQTSAKRQRTKSDLSPEELQKKQEQRRERNRISQAKCRQRKREQKLQLQNQN